MKRHAKSDKKNIDWYFPRVHGRVVVAREKEAGVRSVRIESDNVEARHRDSWRRHLRVFFAAVFLAGPSFQTSHAAESKLSAGPSAVQTEASAIVESMKTTGRIRGGYHPKISLPAVTSAENKAEGEDATLTGIVGGRNYYGIGVAYESDKAERSAKEIWFNLNQDTKFTGIKSVMDLRDGDKVRIVYKQLKAGNKRILKNVTLVAKAPPEPAETRDDDLKSGDENG